MNNLTSTSYFSRRSEPKPGPRRGTDRRRGAGLAALAASSFALLAVTPALADHGPAHDGAAPGAQAGGGVALDGGAGVGGAARFSTMGPRRFKKSREMGGSQSYILGPRVTGFSLEGTDDDHGGFSVTLASEDLTVLSYKDHGNMRTRADASIGGSSDGFEGSLGYGFAIGVRSDFRRKDGVIARIGFDGELGGNQAYYQSHFAIPEVHFGYQIERRRYFIEFAGTGAFVVDGRYNVGNRASRDLGPSAAAGGIALVHVGKVRLAGTYRGIFTRESNLRPVHTANASLCASIRWFAACAGGRVTKGDVLFADDTASDATTIYGGLTLGVGMLEVGPISKGKGRRHGPSYPDPRNHGPGGEHHDHHDHHDHDHHHGPPPGPMAPPPQPNGGAQPGAAPPPPPPPPPAPPEGWGR